MGSGPAVCCSRVTKNETVEGPTTRCVLWHGADVAAAGVFWRDLGRDCQSLVLGRTALVPGTGPDCLVHYLAATWVQSLPEPGTAGHC